MRKLLFSGMLLILIAMVFISPFVTPAVAQEGKVVLIPLGHGEGTKLLDLFVGNLTEWGYTVKFANGTINSTILDGVDILLLGSVWGANYTDAEVNAVKNWFEEGGKAIWVAGDSDYGGGNYIITNANKMLEAINSHIRVEPTSVEDPASNCGAAYRVAANVTNTDDSVASKLVEGVEHPILFHGPSILYGVKDDGTAVALEEESIENVHWVLKTSKYGVINDHDEIPPVAHENGQEGSFVVMAVEMYAGPASNNKIVVSSASPYGDYQPMFSWTYKNVTLDGPTLVKNTIDWMAQVEAPTNWTLYIGVGVGIIVVIAVVIILLKRK